MSNSRWAVGTRMFVEWPGGRVPGRVCGWWRLGVWVRARRGRAGGRVCNAGGAGCGEVRRCWLCGMVFVRCPGVCVVCVIFVRCACGCVGWWLVLWAGALPLAIPSAAPPRPRLAVGLGRRRRDALRLRSPFVCCCLGGRLGCLSFYGALIKLTLTKKGSGQSPLKLRLFRLE